MSLATSAMIVTLNVRCWTARKQDKKVAEEVDRAHGAKDGGRYNKLLVDKTYLDPLTSKAGEIRNEHYKLTLPWMDSGGRLLPSKLFMDWRASMEKLREEYRQLVDAFIQRYESELVPQARKRLGTLYDPADYPRGHELREKFGIEHDIMPVPTANDFRVEVDEQQRELIKSEITERIRSRQADAMRDAWARVRACVSTIYERTSAEKPIIRDSLMENASELVRLLPGLNVSNDPALSAITQEIGEFLLVDVMALRTNPRVRERVAVAAKGILRKLPEEVA